MRLDYGNSQITQTCTSLSAAVMSLWFGNAMQLYHLYDLGVEAPHSPGWVVMPRSGISGQMDDTVNP